jgi:hypothetical protein
MVDQQLQNASLCNATMYLFSLTNTQRNARKQEIQKLDASTLDKVVADLWKGGLTREARRRVAEHLANTMNSTMAKNFLMMSCASSLSPFRMFPTNTHRR